MTIALIVVLVVAVAALWAYGRHRIARLVARHDKAVSLLQTEHDDHVAKLKTFHRQRRDENDAEVAHNLAAAETRAEIERARLTETIEQLRVLYDSATAALAHQATTHDDQAAKLALYAGHLVGLWQPTKEQGRILAAGQRLATFAPTETAKILDRLRSMQPAVPAEQ